MGQDLQIVFLPKEQLNQGEKRLREGCKLSLHSDIPLLPAPVMSRVIRIKLLPCTQNSWPDSHVTKNESHMPHTQTSHTSHPYRNSFEIPRGEDYFHLKSSRTSLTKSDNRNFPLRRRMLSQAWKATVRCQQLQNKEKRKRERERGQEGGRAGGRKKSLSIIANIGRWNLRCNLERLESQFSEFYTPLQLFTIMVTTTNNMLREFITVFVST